MKIQYLIFFLWCTKISFSSKVHSVGCLSLLVRYLKMLSNENLGNINLRLSTFTFENYVKFVLCHLTFYLSYVFIGLLPVPSIFKAIYLPMPDVLALCNVPAFILLKPLWADCEQLFWMNSSLYITCNTLLLFKRWPELVCVTTRDRIQIQHTPEA